MMPDQDVVMVDSQDFIESFNDSLNNSMSIDNSRKKIKLSKEERDRIKLEKESLRQQRELLKTQREKERLEDARRKVARQLELQEEREKKRKEQEMKILLRQQEKEKREQLRKNREQEKIQLREAKEKERLRRAEEKRAIADEEARKKELKIKQNEDKLNKSRAVLFNFLKKPKENSNLDDSITQDKNQLNDSFEIVPECLKEAFNEEDFTKAISFQSESVENLYLNCLLTKKRVPYTKPKIDDNNESMDTEMPEQYRNIKYIYMKFHRNIKPPYFGPKLFNSMINGRKPFTKIPQIDYEFDSDKEWDEGGSGESLNGSDSDEKDEKDDYEIDNEFFVPHGYLSEDEFMEDVKKDEKNYPLLKEQTLLAERSLRFNDKLIPEVVGCIWTSTKHLNCDKYEFLNQFKIVVMPK